MLITRQSIITGRENTMDLDVTPEQLEAWKNGGLIQDHLPHLTVVEREFLISGMSVDEQERVFRRWGNEMNPKDYIEYEDVTESEGPHGFTTFASDLRWRPCQYMRRIETCIGNGQPFILESVDDNRAFYRQGNGCATLTVYND